MAIVESLRGGSTATLDGEDEDVEPVAEVLYMPGLLECSVARKMSVVDAATDSIVTISSKKAKELKVKNGDVVALIGRHRRAAYAVAQIKKTIHIHMPNKLQCCHKFTFERRR